MFYLVGLGNHGEKYEHTRHNVGYDGLRSACARSGLPSPVLNRQVSGEISAGELHGQDVTCLWPHTFMNHSGQAVKKLVPKTDISQLVVLYDDVDLPWGVVKVAKGRGAGGHNGVASIIAALNSKEFVRVRIGIAPRSFWTGKVKRPSGGGPLERFVLGKFSSRESKELPEVEKKVERALELILTAGVEVAMGECNAE